MDEEVGKMAQATPVLISKSLELFMQSIVDDVSKHARACNARKISPTHLKRCVESTECYDFLKDIVESVVDDGDGGGVEVCVAKVAEMEEAGVEAQIKSEGLGGGGGGAPLSMILLDVPQQPQQQQGASYGSNSDQSAEGEDNASDPSYEPKVGSNTRGRGKGRGRARGRGATGRGRGRPRNNTSVQTSELGSE
ncbi:hypothetical protein GGF37_004773 [Kickxella alabastrina]|nr:hypothetical protein GGF37_004773 [Kickxella alabastrina]